jgi:anti-sigma B factor antagonist
MFVKLFTQKKGCKYQGTGTSLGPGAVSGGSGLARSGADDNMKLQLSTETVSVSDIRELDVNNSNDFRDQVRASMSASQRFIEIDLSETTFLDSCGLGALIALHKTTCSRNGLVRLLNPTPPVQQILELTRMHRIFEVVRR